MAIAKILEFIKMDFVFQFGWRKLTHLRMLLSEIVSSLLERFREDLSILNKFVKNNIGLVVERENKQDLVFQVNHIYEKLLFINREMKKM
jgi:hypothetical protein